MRSLVKIRFLMHTVYGAGGGVLTVVRNLAEDLATRHEVELISVVRGRAEPVHALPRGVTVRSLVNSFPGAPASDSPPEELAAPSTFMPANEPHFATYSVASDRALERYLASVRDGALIGMQPGVNLAVARLGRPEVVRIGQDHRPFRDRRGALRDAMVADLPRLDAFLTLTDSDALSYRELLDRRLRVESMPNATPEYSGPLSDLSQHVVVAAGQLRRSKGFDLLIDAWAIVAKSHPDWHLKIFGEGPERDDLLDQVRRLGLQHAVELSGYSTQLHAEFTQASIFVLSSRSEGYGMVIAEAMSCGLPAVSFDCPSGPATLIEHGRNGFLVPNGDVPAMAQHIVATIDLDQKGRQRLAAEALSTARSRSQPVISARWEHLISELMAGKVEAKDRPTKLQTVYAAAKGRLPRRPQHVTQPRRAMSEPDVVNETSVVINAVADPESQRTYVIFGTRRGGTSMVAGLARALGLDLGDVGARKNNEDPRFQYRTRDSMADTIEARNAEHDVWGWKFPAAAGYLPEILPAIRNPYFIIVYRDAVAAALSQAGKDRPGRRRSPRMSLHESNANANANTGFALASQRPCLLVSHEKALGRTDALVNEVADFLAFPRPDDALRARILDYLTPGRYKAFDAHFGTSGTEPATSR